jgi:hypothetical protein
MEMAEEIDGREEIEVVDKILNGGSTDLGEQFDQDKDPFDLADLDLETFWDEVFQGKSHEESEGISFEEALRRGIISPDFNPEDE